MPTFKTQICLCIPFYMPYTIILLVIKPRDWYSPWVFKYFIVYCTDSRWSEANIMFLSKQIQVKRW